MRKNREFIIFRNLSVSIKLPQLQ